MDADQQDLNHAIIARYTDQPARLPPDLRRAIEERWDGAPVQLYALGDLDRSLRLSETWVAVGPNHLATARRSGAGWTIESVWRSRVEAVREAPGLSATTLTLLGRPGDPALLVARYTHRQRRAFENLRFVLEEALQGRAIEPDDADREYAHAVARPVRDAQALVAGRRVAVIRRLLGYLRPYRGRLAIGMTAAAVIRLVSLVPPYLAGYLIDRVIRPAREATLPVGRATLIAWLEVAAMALMYLVRQGAALVRLRLMAILGEWVARDLRAELYEHIQRLSLSFFSRKKTGSLITRVSADTDRLWEFLAFGVVDVSLSLVMLAGLGAVLLSLDWRLGLVMTVPVPVLCWLIYRHGVSINRLFIRAWRKWSRVSDVLSDTIPGIRVVKAFNQEDREIARFGERNEDVTAEFNRIHRMWTGFWPFLMLAVHTTTVLVWVLAVPRLLGSGAALSTGTFVSFLLYTTMFVAPIEVIGQMAQRMNRATTSAHRVFEVLDTEPELKDVPAAVRLEPVRGRVSFDREPDRALLRRDVGIGLDRRRGRAAARNGPLSPSDRHGASGPVPVPRDGAGEHPLRTAGGVARGHDRRGPGGERARLRVQAAPRLRHGRGRTGAYAVGRRAPTRLHRAGDPARSPDPDSGRGNFERGHGDRARDPGGARAAHCRTHGVRHRAPVIDAAPGVAAVRDRGRPDDRSRDASGVVVEARWAVSKVA